jgi:hypothetical protein
MMNPVQPVAPAPVANTNRPFSLPPQQPTTTAIPVTIPVTVQQAPAPQPMSVPTPVITAPQPAPLAPPVPTPAPTYTAAPAPAQDRVIMEPSSTPLPDISALIAQELGNIPQTPPQNPIQ